MPNPVASRSNPAGEEGRQILQGLERRMDRLGLPLKSSDGQAVTIQNLTEALFAVLDILGDLAESGGMRKHPT